MIRDSRSSRPIRRVRDRGCDLRTRAVASLLSVRRLLLRSSVLWSSFFVFVLDCFGFVLSENYCGESKGVAGEIVADRRAGVAANPLPNCTVVST